MLPLSVVTIIASIALSFCIVPVAYSQDFGLATFHESATLLVDRTGSRDILTSITLQSTSTLEMQIPELLEAQIRGDDRIYAIVLTNQEQCILGVVNRSCILLSVERDPEASGIAAVQESARSTAELYIDDLNQLFDTDATFHSVFVHSGNNPSDTATGLPIATAGRTTVSVVYVMPMEDTNTMYEKISAILLPNIIRESGGFYNAAKMLSSKQHAKMSFSFIPLDSNSLFQLKVLSTSNNMNASLIDELKPLDMMGLETLERSDYFASGFYPLNSLVQVAVLSSNSTAIVSDSLPKQLPTREIDGEKVPTDINVPGWIFDPPSGKIINAKYLFGDKTILTSDDLWILLDGTATNSTSGTATDDVKPSIDDIDIVGVKNTEQIMIVIAVVAAAAAATLFYLRGYSGRSTK